MHAKEYLVLDRAVHEGVQFGLNHYWKHRDGKPPDNELGEMTDAIAEHVTSYICDWFHFQGEEEDA